YYSAIDSLFETTYMYNAASSDAFVSEVLGFMDLSPEKLAELQGGGVEVTYSVQTPGGKYSASALQALSGGPEAVFYSKEFRLVNLAVAGLLALGLLFLGAKRFNAFGKGKTAGGAPSNLSRGSGKSKGHVKPGRKKAAMVFLLIALSPLAQGQFTPQPVDVSAFAFTGSPTAFNTHGFSAAEYLWDSIRVSVEPDLHEKALIATEVVGERVAEASAALSSGNVTPELAASASLALQSAGFTTQSVLQQIQSSPAFEGATSPGAAVEGAATQQEEVASAVNQLTAAALSVGQHAQDLHETVKSQVATGAISGEAAAFLDFGSVESATSEVQASLGGEVRSQLIEGIASTQGVPVVEAELFYESGFQASGLGAASTQDIQEELPVIAEKIAEVERQLADAKEQGLILSNAVALTEMVEQAKIKLQETQNALEGDRLGRAFGDLSAAEHLILNADRFIDFEFVQEGITPEGLLPGELAALQEEAPEDVFTEVGEFQERVDSIETQRFEEEKQHAEDYEAFKEELKQKYPDRADYFDEEHARAEKVTALTDEFSGRYEGEVSALQAEGRTGEEAAQIVSEKFADEYRKAYGEPFLPPGFVIEDNFQFVAAGADAERNVGGQVISEGAGGGFLIGTQYDDPASGYKYEFTETGWRFTTPTGQAYEESYPEGYEPPTAFQNGNEEYTYSIETPEGVVEYTYTPTGYEVVTPDGGREAFAYTPGEYKLPDGRSVEYTPTGYELQSTDGVDARYDYNPEFQTYVSTDGTIYTPEQGVTPHYNTEFDSELGDYTYDYGSDTWTFDSDAG
ncbi:MAG TPA: hypothetical protein VJI67_01415, partial [archaeon]|nr:hypothetical protein [archaeon]